MVHRQQALDHGWTRDRIRHQVRRGAWPVIYPGVHATHTGPLSFASRVWAALLHAGPPAMASHRTAARLQGLLDEDPSIVQISVPNGHRTTPQAGLRIHHPRAWAERRQPAGTLPQTRVEETVLDLIDATRHPDEVVHWVLRACQRRLTTPARLQVAAETAWSPAASWPAPAAPGRGGGREWHLRSNTATDGTSRWLTACRWATAPGLRRLPTAVDATSTSVTSAGACGSSWRVWRFTRTTDRGSTTLETTPPSSSGTSSCATAGGR